MATSKRIRKRKVATYFTKFVGKSKFGGRQWFLKKLFHRASLGSLFEREVRTSRMRNKCIEITDYNQMAPFLRRWSIPIVITNPCKKSRIKNHCDSYRALKAEEMPSPDGLFSYTQDELMNLYFSKNKEDN